MSVAPFFATGRQDVNQVLQVLADRGVTVERGRALDFGCGVGRLTRALAERFDSCDGVDVAASMIERARELNQDGERVRFHHNESADLRLFDDGSFDFVVALIVLQHMQPQLMRGYMREFLRVLRPGAVAFFNVPDRFVYDEELPPEAWRASLTLIGTIPPLAPGQIAPVRLKVRNDSPVPWPASAQVRVGDHWRARDGRLVVFDDARASIATALDPDGECEVQLNVVAPAQPGDFELEFDLLQELISWFSDRGSSTLKVPIMVAAGADVPTTGATAAAARRTNQSGQAGFVPQMEIHVMAREEVLATLAEAGGVVLDAIAADRCGPSMESFDYVVARALAPAAPRPRGGQHNPQAVIEARIRGALECSRPGLRDRSEQLLTSDPHRTEQDERGLRLMDQRADLVGFGLTSTLKGAGRASTALRGALRRALFQILYRQTEHNRASDELIRSHETQLEALRATVRAQLDIQAATDERLDALERRLAPIEVNSVTLARRALREAASAGLTGLDSIGFTQRFRGSADEIRERHRRYVPRFEGLSEVLDAGCGRGEFLELLREAGVSAAGVDRDEAVVGRCRELGLDAVLGDALQFLRSRPEVSHGGIFASHLIEHLERAEVLELVRLAFSKLRPGGALVIETVNPMCLLTHATFYGDFTRVGPLPPLALEWLAESCGFAPVEIEYTSPVPAYHKLRPLPTSAGDESEVDAFNRGLAAANDLLFGFQEYALIASKPS